MRIVFHKDFNRTDYALDGASVPGRTEAVMTALVQEMQAKVVESEARVSLAIAEAFRKGQLGIV